MSRVAKRSKKFSLESKDIVYAIWQHIGYVNIDLLVCGNSDPGTSGILSPFGKIQGLYFNDSHEPDDTLWELKQDISRIMKEEGVEYLQINCETKADYYRMLDALVDFNTDALKISGTSKKELNIIIESVEDVDNDTEGSPGDEPD